MENKHTARWYVATFETQKNRILRSWGYLIEAHNQAEAKEAARKNWNRAEHQFHLRARRATPDEIDLLPADAYEVTASKVVTWGRR